MNSKNVVIRLSRDTIAALQKMAARENTTVSRLIRRALAQLLGCSEDELTESPTIGRPPKPKPTKAKR
jgi:predicted transcriptional regulator